jgi:hypothetical protein
LRREIFLGQRQIHLIDVMIMIVIGMIEIEVIEVDIVAKIIEGVIEDEVGEGVVINHGPTISTTRKCCFEAGSDGILRASSSITLNEHSAVRYQDIVNGI